MSTETRKVVDFDNLPEVKIKRQIVGLLNELSRHDDIIAEEKVLALGFLENICRVSAERVQAYGK